MKNQCTPAYFLQLKEASASMYRIIEKEKYILPQG
jgi:hypothetical protein